MKHKNRFLFLCFLVLQIVGAIPAEEEAMAADKEAVSAYSATFKARAGGVVITPTESVRMRGFGDPDTRMSQGAYQDLFVKVLVLDDGENRAAIVGADFIGWPNFLTEEIRKHLKASCGLEPGQNISRWRLCGIRK